MLHSFTWNWLHIVWGTKNHERIIFREVGQILYNFLISKSEVIGVPIERLNIQPEHVHLLINLPSNMCLSDYVRKMKGSSAHWLNENQLLDLQFSWQRGYGAFSISGSQLETVKAYISNQSMHHKDKTFDGEYEAWKIEYYKRTDS